LRRRDKYLIHVVQILRGPVGVEGVGTDAYGEPIEPATPETLAVPARVEWDNRRILDMNGEEKVAAGMVFFPNKYAGPTGYLELTLGIQDRIVFEGREHPVLKVERHEGWGWQTDDRALMQVWIA